MCFGISSQTVDECSTPLKMNPPLTGRNIDCLVSEHMKYTVTVKPEMQTGLILLQ